MTYRGEIIHNRIDSYYYQPKFKALEKLVQGVRFDVVDLGVLISDISSGITPKVDEDYYTDSSGVPFLRVQNVAAQGIDLSDAKFIKREVHEGMLKRSQLNKDDLVFTITGRIGSVAVVPDKFEGNINQHSVRFHLKEQISNININPHSVAVFLNSPLGRFLAIREVTGGTRPALDYKAVKSLKVILPPPDIQNHIVETIESAYVAKRQKDREAATLLDSIDNYVLAELGIEMPMLEEKQCFLINTNQIVGERVDSLFHQPKYRQFKQSLEAGKYRVTPLSSLIADVKNGVEIRTYSDCGYRYLRVSDLGQHGIENYDPRYVNAEEIPDKIRLTNNSLLISRSGSLGLVSIIEDEIREAILSSHIFKVELDTTVIRPKYLETLLRSQIGQTQFFQHNNGGVVPEISQAALRSIGVVVPTLEIQDKIADEAMKQQIAAAKLRQEAEAIVDAAKEEVKRILLQGVSVNLLTDYV